MLLKPQPTRNPGMSAGEGNFRNRTDGIRERGLILGKRRWTCTEARGMLQEKGSREGGARWALNFERDVLQEGPIRRARGHNLRKDPIRKGPEETKSFQHL